MSASIGQELDFSFAGGDMDFFHNMFFPEQSPVVVTLNNGQTLTLLIKQLSASDRQLLFKAVSSDMVYYSGRFNHKSKTGIMTVVEKESLTW